jgi:hypothetical protein
MTRTSVFGTLLSTTILLGTVAISGCSGPVDAEASSSSQAIAQDEEEGTRYTSDFPSADAATTGVDVWDLAFVTKRGVKYLVLSGYTVTSDDVTGESRRTAALDVVFDGKSGWTRPWTKEASGPLSKARALAIAADVAALQKRIDAAASSDSISGSVAPRSNSNWTCYTTGEKLFVGSLVVGLGSLTFIGCMVGSAGTAVVGCGVLGVAAGGAATRVALFGQCSPARSNP